MPDATQTETIAPFSENKLVSAMQQNMTLEAAVGFIKSDLPSWKGISLFYAWHSDGRSFATLSAAVKIATRNKSGAMSFFGKNNQAIALGLDFPRDLLSAATACCWIDDMARQQALTNNVLAAVTEKNYPAISGAERSVQSAHDALSILIVEDDPVISKILTMHLGRFGAVTTTANSREAVANYMVRRPNIIFLDIHYKDDKGDGFDVLQSLLSADENAFVIMVSGDGTAETVFKALKLGAQGFITKPFGASDFTNYLNKLEGRKE